MRELGSRQMAEWSVFEKLEGFIGQRGAYDRAALLAALYTERHRDPKKRAKPITPDDFRPWVDRPEATAATFRAGFHNVVKRRK